jgi:hypothetical protein
VGFLRCYYYIQQAAVPGEHARPLFPQLFLFLVSRRPLFPQLFLFLVWQCYRQAFSTVSRLEAPAAAATSHRASTTVTSPSHQTTVPVTGQQLRSPVISHQSPVISHSQRRQPHSSHRSSATVSVVGHRYSSRQPSSHGHSSNCSSETASAIQSDMAAVYSAVPVHGEQVVTFPQPVPCRSSSPRPSTGLCPVIQPPTSACQPASGKPVSMSGGGHAVAAYST